MILVDIPITKFLRQNLPSVFGDFTLRERSGNSMNMSKPSTIDVLSWGDLLEPLFSGTAAVEQLRTLASLASVEILFPLIQNIYTTSADA